VKNVIYGKHEQNTLDQFNNVMKNADKGALMADGHLGYVMPIGGVAAYKNKISPVGVGFDIACGNMAVKLDIDTSDLDLNKLLDKIQENISFGIGQTNPNAPKNHPVFDSPFWDSYPLTKSEKNKLKTLAKNQLGTVGSGNHYVDIFRDKEGYCWIGVHFGSRGLGHKTATGFLNLAVNGDWTKRAKEQEVLLDLDSDIGGAYYDCMRLAGQYAYAGREWVCQTIAEIIGVDTVYTVHNHHNFAWEEEHDGEKYIVIRKGATPAFPNQEGVIGGSMGDDAVIVKGIESKKSKETLYSTVHGAGRVMSRTEAAGKQKWMRGEDGKKRPVRVSEGKVSWKMLKDWIDSKGVLLRGGGLDESPHAYRRLTDVLKEHEGTIKVLHTLKPIGVVMAGENEFDPYKD